LSHHNPLDRAVAERDLILVTGKGGVGKSTVVGALARMAAKRRGGAVAVEISALPRLPALVNGESRVELVNIDLDSALPRVLSRLLRVPALLGAALNNRVMRQFIKTSPAVSETILLDEIYDLVQHASARHHPVIVDLPASGHAVSLLGTPRSVHRMLRVGPVANRAREIEKLLLDRQRSELVIVALPEELPVNETIELVRRATEVGLAARIVVVNQVPIATVAEEDRQLLALMHQGGDAGVAQVADVVQDELDGADQVRSQIERLRSTVPGPLVEVPLSSECEPARRTDDVARALAL